MKMKLLIMLFLSITTEGIFAQASWTVAGNAISSGDFLGTTNARPLVIKVSSSQSGVIDYDGTKANTGFGYQTLLTLSTGVEIGRAHV